MKNNLKKKNKSKTKKKKKKKKKDASTHFGEILVGSWVAPLGLNSVREWLFLPPNTIKTGHFQVKSMGFVAMFLGRVRLKAIICKWDVRLAPAEPWKQRGWFLYGARTFVTIAVCFLLPAEPWRRKKRSSTLSISFWPWSLPLPFAQDLNAVRFVLAESWKADILDNFCSPCSLVESNLCGSLCTRRALKTRSGSSARPRISWRGSTATCGGASSSWRTDSTGCAWSAPSANARLPRPSRRRRPPRPRRRQTPVMMPVLSMVSYRGKDCRAFCGVVCRGVWSSSSGCIGLLPMRSGTCRNISVRFVLLGWAGAVGLSCHLGSVWSFCQYWAWFSAWWARLQCERL